MTQPPVPGGPLKPPIASPASSAASATPPVGVPKVPALAPATKPPSNPAIPALKPPSNPAVPALKPPSNPAVPALKPPSNPSVPTLGAAVKPPSNPELPVTPAKAAGPVSAVVMKAKAEQDILTGIERLPSLPTVIFEVMQTANNPNSCAKSFEEILKKDQMLTARVLKLVNSSFFARQRKITTISESVVVLGFNTLKSIVTAASAAKILGKKMEGYGYAEYGLWKHCFATALTSKLLATTLKAERLVVEEVFIAGLLHDIGKLVLDPIVRERITALKEEVVLKKKPRIEAERAALGFDHAEIGVKVAKKWNLPEHIEESITAHHALENAREHGKMAAIVALADNLMNKAGVGLIQGRTIDEAVPPMVFDVLSIQSGDVDGLRTTVEGEMETIRKLSDQLSAP